MFLIVPGTLWGVNTRTPEEVGKLIRARRKELHMTEADLQAAAKIDSKTLKALESGSRASQEKTELRVEPALHWGPGSIDNLREGGNPVELPDFGGAPPAIPIEDISDDELLAEVKRRMQSSGAHEAEDGRPGTAADFLPPRPGDEAEGGQNGT